MLRGVEVIIRKLEFKGLNISGHFWRMDRMEKGRLKDVAFHHKLFSSM